MCKYTVKDYTGQSKQQNNLDSLHVSLDIYSSSSLSSAYQKSIIERLTPVNTPLQSYKTYNKKLPFMVIFTCAIYYLELSSLS